MSDHTFDFVRVADLAGDTPGRTIRDHGESFSALDGTFEYRDTLPHRADHRSDAALIGDDPGNPLLRAFWTQIVADASPIRIGMIDLEDVTIFSHSALLLKPDRGLCLIGPEVNWVVEMAIWILHNCCTPPENLRWLEFGKRFRINLPATVPEEPPGVLMSTPGQPIYGHWILDIAPRLLLAALGGGRERPAFYFHHVPQWAASFLRAFGVGDDMVRLLPPRPFTRFAFVTMPSGTRDGFRLDRAIHAMAWTMLKRFFETEPISPRDAARLPAAARIFVNRRGWAANRPIANIDRLEELAVERGYVSVEPSTFAVAAQARLFRNARIVLGEDGSALHNIVFAEKGCALGVIGTSVRTNFWHLAICDVLGHRVSYASTTAGPGGIETVDEAAYAALLDRLEDVASF